jgi:hypothetical protein
MARPKKQIDPKIVQDLAALGCKTNEIAVTLGCSTDTLERRFAAELSKGRENLRISLRRWQLEAAKKGNVAMLIWLGKQMLGQTEKVEQTSEVKAHVEAIEYVASWGGTSEPTGPGHEG